MNNDSIKQWHYSKSFIWTGLLTAFENPSLNLNHSEWRANEPEVFPFMLAVHVCVCKREREIYHTQLRFEVFVIWEANFFPLMQYLALAITTTPWAIARDIWGQQS